MEYLSIKKLGYQIIFEYNEYILKIYIKDKKRIKKFKFASINIIFEDNLTKYISNFKDLINKIKEKIISIEIIEHLSSQSQSDSNKKTNIKYLELNIKIKNINLNKINNIISRNIYV